MNNSVLPSKVKPEQVDLVAPLFDAYRQFYGKSSNVESARQFLLERLQRGESVIFAVIEDGKVLGFTQLYPTFSSISMKPIWILNDLFVAEDARRQGIGARLLMAARGFGQQTGADRLTLSTEIKNSPAQALYERKRPVVRRVRRSGAAGALLSFERRKWIRRQW
jgi:GNAT superfamily N-acetyltransferase